MAKKALKEAVIEKISQARHVTEPAATTASDTDPRSALAESVLRELADKPGSPDSRLSLLVESVVAHLGEGDPDRAQLHDFLSLILDTDPSLKEELLAGLAQTK